MSSHSNRGSLTKCKDKSCEPKIYPYGEYWLLQNGIRANHGELQCTDSVTFGTHGDHDHAYSDHSIQVLER